MPKFAIFLQPKTINRIKMKTKKRFFRRITAPAVFGAMLLLLTACPRKEPVYVDLGRIPEQYLATVPYRNGDVFRMQHESDRVVIDFTVSRHRQKEMGYDYLYEKLKPAPNYIYEYEADITKCTPNYPIFEVEISFSNDYMAYEEEGMQAWNKCANLFAVGNARIPLFGEDYSSYEMVDSLKVNGRYYHDVFKLKSELVDYYEEEGSIHADTYYYNYENGLLEVVMSNGEKYWLYEE